MSPQLFIFLHNTFIKNVMHKEEKRKEYFIKYLKKKIYSYIMQYFLNFLITSIHNKR